VDNESTPAFAEDPRFGDGQVWKKKANSKLAYVESRSPRHVNMRYMADGTQTSGKLTTIEYGTVLQRWQHQRGMEIPQ
jgi:hypothetical protein